MRIKALPKLAQSRVHKQLFEKFSGMAAMSSFSFEQSMLWDRTLGASAIDANVGRQHDVERLRTAFIRFRQNAAHLAQQISADLRSLTVHDISHIDALWDIASTLLGPEYNINPLEGFLLGSTFLLHDLGLALCAYPRGADELREDVRWKDIVAQAISNRDGVTPSQIDPASIPPEIASEATESLLRLLHAERAPHLATRAFIVDDESRNELYLIEDHELRLHFAELLGQLAYSHWWSVEAVEGTFNRFVGSLPGFSSDWTVDPLKIALALRVADACHIDSRRAPVLLRALLRPDGYAKTHWVAQQHLLTPRREGERLDFTAATSFRVNESKAWWTAYELAILADRELRATNELLQRTQRQQFAARWVSGIDAPETFSRHVPTLDWRPVDTRLRVGDVPRLVASLGGRNLYGGNGTVPLRELLQNARDAVVARRLLETRPDNWGEIVVRVGQEGDHHWIEVEDSGKGMSRELLAGHFLDFGGSYWNSRLAASECPGLFARGFNPAGRFGIGFYSVFMWGGRVTVRSRTLNDGRQDTRVLEFNHGLDEPPILRRANIEEELRDAGTTVRVWLSGRPDAAGGPLAGETRLYRYNEDRGPFRKPRWSLSELCAWLCPALDVTLIVDDGNCRQNVVSANDWLTLDPATFIRRLHIGFEQDFVPLFESDYFMQLSSLVRVIYDDQGRGIGRAVLMPLHSPDGPAQLVPCDDGFSIDLRHPLPKPTFVLTAGPFRAETLPGMRICGILLGRPSDASRFRTTAIGERGRAVGEWATQQGQLLTLMEFPAYELADIAKTVQGCGGRPLGLPIARDKHRFLTPEDIESIDSPPASVELYEETWRPGSYPLVRHTLEESYQFGVNALSMQSAGIPFRDMKLSYREPQRNSVWMRFRHSLLAANVEAWAKRWNASIDEVLKCSTIDIPPLGRHDFGKPVVLRNPKSI